MRAIAKASRVRFSPSEFARIAAVAKSLKKPFASVVRAMCRLADDDEKRIRETIALDSVRMGRIKERKA